jgi:hypothetical protein
MKTLEVEQRIDEARGCGITIIDRDQIGAERVAEIGLVAQRLVIGLTDQIARQRRMIKPLGDPMSSASPRMRSQIGSSAASFEPCGLT